jgi:hypothetical protein
LPSLSVCRPLKHLATGGGGPAERNVGFFPRDGSRAILAGRKEDAMPDPTPDPNPSPSGGGLPERPEVLPHGLLKPPQEVLDALAREKAKFPPEVYTPEFEQRTLNDWTVDFVFAHRLGYFGDILYRPTPEGPEVLAVGFDEIHALTRDMPAEERAKFNTWCP